MNVNTPPGRRRVRRPGRRHRHCRKKRPLPPQAPPPAAPPTFPYPHISVQTSEEANSPAGTVFVTLDDGTTQPATARARAVPADGNALP
jgi:hypothetical protein